MKTLTIQLTDEQWQEIQDFWDLWNDESFAIHAAYYFREALVRGGYMEEKERWQ